jgi:hypothetical protein
VSTQSDNDPHTPSLTEYLITRALGYCCLWAFFSLFRQTGQIAQRLGVTPRTIRLYKARFRGGGFKCEGCEKCMKKVVKTINHSL